MKDIKKNLNKINEYKFKASKHLKDDNILIAYLNEIFLEYDNLINKLLTETQGEKNEI